MFAILGILAVTCAVGVVLISDDSSASTFSLVPSDDKDYGKVSSSITYELDFDLDSSSATYTAELQDSDGKAQSGAISTSSSSGTIYSTSHTKSFYITLPSTAGDYYLKVTVTEGETVYTRTAYVKAVDPIKLTASLENTSAVSRTFYAYFWVIENGEWTKIDDKKTVTVDAHGTATVTHDYIVKDVHNTTYCLKSDDEAAIGGAIIGLGEDNARTFYTEANDYKVIEYICIAVLVVLLIVAFWIYRKPVRNRGKPKGRR